MSLLSQRLRTFASGLAPGRNASPLVRQDFRLAIVMITPAILLVIIFAILPMLQGLYASFFQIESATLEMTFNGLGNYIWLLSKPLFWQSLLRSLIWVTSTTVMQFLLGVGISLLLHQELKARNIARGMVLFPYLIPAIVISLTWRFILDPTMGVFNRMLMDFGIIERPIAFLTRPNTALLFVIVAGIWKYTPFVVLMTLARLQVIPVELEEAARLDGASSWQLFRHITLPWLMPVIVVTLLLRTIWTFRQFDIVYLFAFGGPLFGTTTLPVLVRYLAFDAEKIGAAAATATLMLLMLLVMSWGYFRWYGIAEEKLD
ncbi:MAG: sugar ABC transporter permease [Caldilineae bacterium]|nr:MAG: sugar ABC transporter permease [Caldilineae bacterium]